MTLNTAKIVVYALGGVLEVGGLLLAGSTDAAEIRARVVKAATARSLRRASVAPASAIGGNGSGTTSC